MVKKDKDKELKKTNNTNKKKPSASKTNNPGVNSVNKPKRKYIRNDKKTKEKTNEELLEKQNIENLELIKDSRNPIQWQKMMDAKYRTGALGGRPPKYKTVEEMQERIIHYFNSITISKPRYKGTKQLVGVIKGINRYQEQEVPVLDNNGEIVIDTEYIEQPSIMGLILHLGMTKTTFREYEQKPEFKETIKQAKHNIEKYLTGMLSRKEQVTGIIFNLKANYGWTDKIEIDHNVQGEIESKIIMIPSNGREALPQGSDIQEGEIEETEESSLP